METRTGTDAAGMEWAIFEIDRPLAPGRRATTASGWLCFQRSDGYVVHVPRGDYPSGWKSLSAYELLAIIERETTTS